MTLLITSILLTVVAAGLWLYVKREDRSENYSIMLWIAVAMFITVSAAVCWAFLVLPAPWWAAVSLGLLAGGTACLAVVALL